MTGMPSSSCRQRSGTRQPGVASARTRCWSSWQRTMASYLPQRRMLGPGHPSRPNGAAMTHDDEHFLRRAIELAATGRAAGDAPFGALLVGPDGPLLAPAHNTLLTHHPITAPPQLQLSRWAAPQPAPPTP